MSERKLHLFIFIDSFGYELVKKYGPLLEEVKHTKPVKMQFGYSATAIPSILTGEKPSGHGQFTFFYRSATGDSMFKFFDSFWFRLIPDFISRRRRFRVLLSKLLKSFFNIEGYFDLYAVPFDRLKYFDYSEKNDLFDVNAFEGIDNLKDVLVKNNISHFISDWRKSEDYNFQALNNQVSNEKPEFIFAYFAGLDGVQHMHTKDGDETKKKLTYYKKEIKRLLANCRKNYDEVEFAIFSDHGMTTLKEEHDLNGIFSEIGLTFGEDYISFIDSTMLRLWYLKPKVRDLVRGKVIEKTVPGRFLEEHEMKEWGVFYSDNKYGDDIFLVDPGVQLNPSDMGSTALPGMHGYDPSDKDSDAVWMANYKAKQEPDEVREIFNCMLEKIEFIRGNS